MSNSREALHARFRASLQTRVKTIASLLEALELNPGQAEATRAVLGELHTLKGEARMVGARALADLTHRLEDEVGRGGDLDFPKLGHAIVVMAQALSQSDPVRSDLTIQAAILQFSGPTPAESRSHPSNRPSSSTDHESSESVSSSAASPAPTSSPPSEQDESPRVEESSQGKLSEEGRWVSVEASRIDALCELVTELTEGLGRLQREVSQQLPTGSARALRINVDESFSQYRTLLDSCVDATWGLRLVRIEPMLMQLEQHVRLLARRIDKPIEVTVSAGGVQLERDVTEHVWDSLVHLVRNAVAHGIESAAERGDKPEAGRIRLSAESSGPDVVIAVEDDGRGLDPRKLRAAASAAGVLSEEQSQLLTDREAVQLIFRHGFSTEEQVDDVSGRGVGLDVVKDKIEKLGGSVTVETTPNVGTRFILTVPFAITKERVMVIDSGAGFYAIPVRVIRRIVGAAELEGASEAVRVDGVAVPLRSFTRCMQLPDTETEDVAVLVDLGGRTFAVTVKAVIGEREVIRRPAEPLLAECTGIGASSVLSDGRPVLLPELTSFELALSRGRGVRSRGSDAGAPPRVVVADDSVVVTEMISELLRSSGLSVEVAKDGVEALAAVERQPPDLVITDFEMPRMNGLELLTRVRELSRTLPVIMLTTRGSVEDRQRASSLGANAYVLKSGFQSDALVEVVGRFVRTR